MVANKSPWHLVIAVKIWSLCKSFALEPLSNYCIFDFMPILMVWIISQPNAHCLRLASSTPGLGRLISLS